MRSVTTRTSWSAFSIHFFFPEGTDIFQNENVDVFKLLYIHVLYGNTLYIDHSWDGSRQLAVLWALFLWAPLKFVESFVLCVCIWLSAPKTAAASFISCRCLCLSEKKWAASSSLCNKISLMSVVSSSQFRERNRGKLLHQKVLCWIRSYVLFIVFGIIFLSESNVVNWATGGQ